MSKIRGIKVRLTVGSGQWNGTRDRLYLGIYGRSGPMGQGTSGREFPLYADSLSVLNDGAHVVFVFGDSPCCPQNGQIQAIKSNGYQANNPALHNRIDLAKVEFVYLRKTANTADDDWLVIEDAEVILCADNNDIRKFSNNGTLQFANETGHNHWLHETPPPGCRVRLELISVKQVGTGHNGHPAGRKWDLTLIGYGNFNPIQLDTSYNASYANQENWEHSFNFGQERFIVGCCENQDLHLVAKAVENDVGQNDTGQESENITIACTPTGQSQEGSIVVTVQGWPGYSSELTFKYRVTATCLA